jgi:hypothetical protein
MDRRRQGRFAFGSIAERDGALRDALAHFGTEHCGARLLLRLTRNNILAIPVTADALDIAAAKLPPGLRIEAAALP